MDLIAAFVNALGREYVGAHEPARASPEGHLGNVYLETGMTFMVAFETVLSNFARQDPKASVASILSAYALPVDANKVDVDKQTAGLLVQKRATFATAAFTVQMRLQRISFERLVKQRGMLTEAPSMGFTKCAKNRTV